MISIQEYNITDYGCIGDLCPSKEDCYVGISQNATCVTNAEAEETAKMILKSLEATLLEKFNISFNREDNTEIVRMLKNYVIDEQLRNDGIEIEDIQAEVVSEKNGFTF